MDRGRVGKEKDKKNDGPRRGEYILNGERIPDIRIGEYLVDDMMKCVGKKPAVYIKKFEKLQQKGYGFNWCAGIFTTMWFAYRKMWKEAAALMGFNFAYSFVYSLVEARMMAAGKVVPLMWGTILAFIVTVVVFGMLGEWLYFRHVSKILEEQGCRGRSAVENTALNESLKKAGGTSILGLIVFWLISLALTQVLNGLLLY